MTPEQLAYWLQGFAELHPEPPSPAQWQSIREHVASVFEKETAPLADEPYVPRLVDIQRILRRPQEIDDILFPKRRTLGRQGGRGRLIC